MKRAVTYYRVSTKRQGFSGLGLDAQREAVERFVQHNNYVLEGEFVEIESGKHNNRPVLQKALKSCAEKKATLLIAKLDRLSRNVAFISTLMESGVEFKAVDNPYAEKLLVHIMAAFAEHEREQISKRTIASLKAAKARGIELGSYGRHILSKENKRNAELFALKMKPTIERIQKKGITTVRGITKELNRLKVPTYTNIGCKWHPTTVHTLIKRMKSKTQENDKA